MKLVALTCVLFGALLMAACGKTETTVSINPPTVADSPAAKTSSTPDELAVTRGIFQKDCAECHGSDGSGGTKIIDNQPLNVPTLLEGHALKHSDEDFIQQISSGGDGMPGFKDKISEADTKNLVRLIRRDFQGQ